jgi:predicted small secreted protein
MKKFLSLALSVLLLLVFSSVNLANENPLERAKKAQLASEVKRGIAYLGVGKSSVVRVELYDKTKYHGYIAEITDEDFVVADAKTGATAPIAYSEVKGIKGNNLSTGAKIGIGVAIAAAVVIIISVLASKDEGQSPNGQIICVHAPCP